MFIAPRFSRLALAVVALAAMFTFAARSQAEDTPAAGAATGISGQVVNEAGTGVKGASVKLFSGAAPAHNKKAPAANITVGNGAVELAKGDKRTALQEATTDDKGNFTFTNLTAGDYTVIATSDDPSGTGKLSGHVSVTVTSGQTATATVTVKVHKAKKAA